MSERRSDGAPELELAKSAALRLLSYRPRSTAELTSALTGRGFGPDVAEAVVDTFLEVGLLDDWAYAREWARSRQDNRGLSTSTIRHELRRKGVAQECVEAALVPVAAGEEDAARELLVRSGGRVAALPTQVQVRRLSGRLARRGYPADMVMRLVREHVESKGEELAADSAVGDL